MKKKSLETLQAVREAQLEAARRELAKRLSETEQAALRLSQDRSHVVAEERARAQTEEAEKGRGELRASELSQLHLHSEASRGRQAQLEVTAEASRKNVEAARRAEHQAAERVVESAAAHDTTRRLAEQAKRRLLERQQATAEEEALETWAARNK